MFRYRLKASALLFGSLFLVFMLVIISNVNPPSAFIESDPGDEEYLKELNECTTGLASGLATPDGRPLLWKNRDVGNADQEFHYVDDGRIPFISITYRGETDEYYGGINAAGFAVENSNSYNLPGGPYRNGWGAGDDDGEIHMLALATCRTVDDFQALMDSTDIDGRTLNSNYGTFDAFGGAAMFETGGYSYTRIDAAETEDGFIVRSNYSYSGHSLNNRANYWGPHRYDKATELWKQAVNNDNLTPHYIFQQVIRNLSIEGMDDYALPYDGYVDNLPYGIIPNGEAICRATTRGIMVAQGVRNGERPDDAILWAMAGNPLGTLFTPLWVRAGSVPTEYDGAQGSRICQRGIEIADWVYSDGGVDTWRLTNPEGTGIWDYTFRLEDYVIEKTMRFVNSPQFSYDRLANFQNEIAAEIADSLQAWRPVYTATELAEPAFYNGHIYLVWERVEKIDESEPNGYRIYRSPEPFRDGSIGELIAYSEELHYTDTDPLPGSSFYRVEAVF